MGIALKISKVALQNVFKDTKTNFAKNKSDLLASDKNVGANEDTTSNIEWNHLNYPWGLNLVHYNARELDAKASNLSRIAHYATFIVYGALSLNLLDVIILASFGISPMRILYSLFNIILIAPVVCGTFYLSFVILATKSSRYLRSYTASQSMLCALYITLAILGEGPINGFAKFLHIGGEIPESKGAAATFWIIAIVSESCIYLTSFILSVYIILRIRSLIKIPAPAKMIA